MQLIWPTRDASVAIASGIEARMIEAEAAYKAGEHRAVHSEAESGAHRRWRRRTRRRTLTDPGTNVDARKSALPRARVLAVRTRLSRRRHASPHSPVSAHGGDGLPDGRVAQGRQLRNGRELPGSAGGGEQSERGGGSRRAPIARHRSTSVVPRSVNGVRRLPNPVLLGCALSCTLAVQRIARRIYSGRA